MNLILKNAGIVLLIFGLILSIKPNLAIRLHETISPYEMIEKRIIWGIFVGLGLFIIFYYQIDSWKTGIFGLLSALTLGIMISRIIGLIIDGFFAKQFLWLGIEFLFLVIFTFLFWKLKR